MTEYEFELVFAVPAEIDHDAMVDALYEAGCDDALIGTGTPGSLGMMFTREAPSANEAVRSAIGQVKAVIPAAELIEAKPDLVSPTDVAEIAGVTRQYVARILSRKMLHPAVSGRKITMYHLAEIEAHFSDYIPARVGELAWITRFVNHERDVERIERKIAEPKGKRSERRA